ncbi:hypothetical protein [Homoserinibacter sp. GY 40078]|uniref:hypothetical protein n=1 Tax=Homoserinibacter sp. GY 40078 TaxID=2603275 RepID=UPI0011CCA76A|nr:hypothetical protein [Homoserinibacter sp. GY 40078]TXK17407.1 hypothetical protein FVQ89_11270 [Homoserinibacter sp. GY 40078]
MNNAVDITPGASPESAPTIEFNIVGYGKFELPVLGQPGVPLGITTAFGIFQDAENGNNDSQKLAAWSHLIQSLVDSFPKASRILARLDGPTVAQVFRRWGEKSNEYDPSLVSSPL